MGALTNAQEIRMLRVQLRRDLETCRNKRESLAMVVRFINDPPWWVENMTVGDLLLSCRAVGRSVTIRICDHAAASPLRTIGELTPGRRERLVVAINRVIHDYR